MHDRRQGRLQDSKVAAEDRTAFRSCQAPKKGQQRTYRLDIARPQTSGGVAEVTPGKDKIDPKALQSIGSKIVSAAPSRLATEVSSASRLKPNTASMRRSRSKLKEAYGPSYEEDLCKEKYPGRLLVEEVLGASETSAPELPGSNLTLNDRLSKRRGSR